MRKTYTSQYPSLSIGPFIKFTPTRTSTGPVVGTYTTDDPGEQIIIETSSSYQSLTVTQAMVPHEPATHTNPAPAPTPEQPPTQTVRELKEHLTNHGVKLPRNATRAQLIDLAAKTRG